MKVTPLEVSSPFYSRRRLGFTLVEMLAAMAVFLVLVVILTQITNVASRSWIDGEARVESFQSGRAILNLMAGELGTAVVGPRWQYVQNPALPSGLSTGVAPNSDSLFWQTISEHTDRGNVAITGYYLVHNPTAKTYQLRRLFISADSPRMPANFSPSGQTRTSEAGAPWVAALGSSAFEVSGNDVVSSTLADGVVGFWVRPYDAAGNLIPWWFNSPAASGSEKIKYNSAATFQRGRTSDDSEGPAFAYTAAGTTYMPRGDALPSAVEITLLMVDPASLKKGFTVPEPPPISAPDDLLAKLNTYKKSLTDAGFRSHRVFTARIPLQEAR